ncbi:AgmX/PglI C-terminal domain-containing protein, partial [Myxococcota bacterium]|nr:AgmX/PglI C-terminal domain-containing protein [Myxococcota bacterium]
EAAAQGGQPATGEPAAGTAETAKPADVAPTEVAKVATQPEPTKTETARPTAAATQKRTTVAQRTTQAVATPKKTVRDEPPPPPPEPKKTVRDEEPARGGSDEDDLLGAATKKKTRQIEAPSSELPRQLEDSDVLGGLRKNKAAIAACLQKQRASDPGLEGTMTVSFVIEGSGQTKRGAVAPDKFKSSVVGKCVLDAVRTWSFPRFSGPPMPVDFPVRVQAK